jgi:hypothetical protein
LYANAKRAKEDAERDDGILCIAAIRDVISGSKSM